MNPIQIYQYIQQKFFNAQGQIQQDIVLDHFSNPSNIIFKDKIFKDFMEQLSVNNGERVLEIGYKVLNCLLANQYYKKNLFNFPQIINVNYNRIESPIYQIMLRQYTRTPAELPIPQWLQYFSERYTTKDFSHFIKEEIEQSFLENDLPRIITINNQYSEYINPLHKDKIRKIQIFLKNQKQDPLIKNKVVEQINLKQQNQQPILITIQFDENSFLDNFFKNIFGSFYFNFYQYLITNNQTFLNESERIKEFYVPELPSPEIKNYFDFILLLKELINPTQDIILLLHQIIPLIDILNITKDQELLVLFYISLNHIIFKRDFQDTQIITQINTQICSSLNLNPYDLQQGNIGIKKQLILMNIVGLDCYVECLLFRNPIRLINFLPLILQVIPQIINEPLLILFESIKFFIDFFVKLFITIDVQIQLNTNQDQELPVEVNKLEFHGAINQDYLWGLSQYFYINLLTSENTLLLNNPQVYNEINSQFQLLKQNFSQLVKVNYAIEQRVLSFQKENLLQNKYLNQSKSIKLKKCLSFWISKNDELFLKNVIDFFLEVSATGVKIQNKSKFLNRYLLQNLALKFQQLDFLSESLILFQFCDEAFRTKKIIKEILEKYSVRIFNVNFTKFLVDKTLMEEILRYNYKFWGNQDLKDSIILRLQDPVIVKWEYVKGSLQLELKILFQFFYNLSMMGFINNQYLR